MATLADLSSASPQSPDDATLAGLSPAARAKYKAQLPEILRAARSASNARGMFYSGDAVDAETKAQEALLAQLATQDIGATDTASQAEATRQLERETTDKNIQAQKRQALLSILGQGTGAAATIGGLAMLHPNAPANVIPLSGGRYGNLSPDGKSIIPISEAGSTSAAPQVGGAALNPAPPLSTSGLVSGDFGPSAATAGTAGVGAGAVAAKPSMWQSATSAPMMAGGAVGGLAGLAALRGVGVNSANSNVGAGLGGLGAYGLYSAYGSGNPYLAAGSALAGTFGGGLLGNLFK